MITALIDSDYYYLNASVSLEAPSKITPGFEIEQFSIWMI